VTPWVPELCTPRRWWANALRIGGVYEGGSGREIASGECGYFAVAVALVAFNEQRDSCDSGSSKNYYRPCHSSNNGGCGHAALLSFFP
jgi:hypothetical protein